MAQNFLPCDRDQELLLPPSLREWLPEDHLAWFVLESVAELDLEAFYAAYRSDGWGAAAHDPQMMVALLIYSYAIGVRSARGIEGAVATTSRSGRSRPIRSPTMRRSRAFVPATSRRSPSCSAGCSGYARGRGL